MTAMQITAYPSEPTHQGLSCGMRRMHLLSMLGRNGRGLEAKSFSRHNASLNSAAFMSSQDLHSW